MQIVWEVRSQQPASRQCAFMRLRRYTSIGRSPCFPARLFSSQRCIRPILSRTRRRFRPLEKMALPGFRCVRQRECKREEAHSPFPHRCMLSIFRAARLQVGLAVPSLMISRMQWYDKETEIKAGAHRVKPGPQR
jgi:hypothetical protein